MFYGPKVLGRVAEERDTDYALLGRRIQEGGRRAGTENVAGIVGMGKLQNWHAPR